MLEKQLVGQATFFEPEVDLALPGHMAHLPPSFHDITTSRSQLGDFVDDFPDLVLGSPRSPYMDLLSSGLTGGMDSLPSTPSSRDFLSQSQELNINSLMRADLYVKCEMNMETWEITHCGPCTGTGLLMKSIPGTSSTLIECILSFPFCTSSDTSPGPIRSSHHHQGSTFV